WRSIQFWREKMDAQFTRLARRLLIFNLLLQLFDGVVVSSLVCRGGRIQPASPHCDCELGRDSGVVLPQDSGLHAAGSSIRRWSEKTIASDPGFGDYRIGLYLFWPCVSLGAAQLGAIPRSPPHFNDVRWFDDFAVRILAFQELHRCLTTAGA